MDSKSLLTSGYRLDAAERFITSVEDSMYYFFVGNHLNPNTVVTPTDNPKDTTLNAYYNMIFGKRIQSNDIALMIQRYDYVANTAYAMYDHSDPILYDRNFFVVVHEGTQYDVFKCLDNNGGARSLITPSRLNVNLENDDFYFPNDGYRWKYMYSVSDDIVDKFATPSYIPVVTSPGVKSHAIHGAIDVIQVASSGKGYSNYLDGRFGVGDIRLNGDPKKYGISTSGVKTTNGFYDACWLYIASGPGAGQYKQIESYTSNSTYNSIELVDPFDPVDQPENTSTFEIYPSVNIRGDGSETIDAHARAIIDPNGNTVSRIEMLARGQDYNLASASVLYSASVGVTEQAVLKPIYSPTNGHGYNSAAELGGHHVGFGLKLVGSESNTVITNNDYSQWGILKNPEFKKVTLTSNDLNKDFSTNEWVYKINPVQLIGNCSTVKNSNTDLTNRITITGVDARTIVKPKDQLLFVYENNYLMANVTSANSSTIIIDRVATFDTAGSGGANVYVANTSSKGLVDGFSAGSVDLTKVTGVLSVGDTIIGIETGTYGTIDTVKITDVTKNFNTFMQTHIYIGSMTQGEFTTDESVYQIANAIASARFHSIVDDAETGTKRIYTTNQVGVFNTAVDGVDLSDEIIGLTSGAMASLTNKYLPDLVFGSGEVMYLENFTAVTRLDEKTETFKLILDF